MPDIFEVNDKVQKALEKYFQQHRLVFWYDDKADMKSCLKVCSLLILRNW
jgi:hypothetical protein